ncbi:SGNH/GDSL hydrolase family protein [Ramlibacter solisilvae]|uniref:GDSL family lipase n=1 Tax=Ramlibacter tataouinensis TaxID=94132 RepID=A0A127JZG4_9BURK|nr:SGNH/GDSL hydrolase family protein [Ramlibacter tataouinensis]AMO25357.1 GDSL family lipase [Ramlibacter tataouinensis]
MGFQWIRRALFGLASASLLLLGACGSGTIESQLKPTRVIAFGDAFSDAGQTGAKYMVNDGSLTWGQIVAFNYGIDLKPAAQGGLAYAVGNARVLLTPDAAGNSATPTIKQQIDTFLSTHSTLNENDLVMIGGGFSDIIAESAAVRSGAQTTNQMLANLQKAGQDLAAQAKRLRAAGATHIVVTGVYDLGRTPWAGGVNQRSLLTSASSAFNDALLVALVQEGANMLYVDQALLFNLMFNSPASYSFSNVVDPICTSVDAGPGIGIGTGQLNSALCTTATLVPGVAIGSYLFSDAVYPTPAGHARFGDYAFSRVTSRW